MNLKNLEVVKLEEIKFLRNPENLFSNLNNLKEVGISYCKFSNNASDRKLEFKKSQYIKV